MPWIHLCTKKISANMSEDNTQKDIWSRSRNTYKLFSALDDPRESNGYVPPPSMKATASTVSMEDCDEALASDALHHVGKSSKKKKKKRAKTDTPKGGFSTGLKEFALLRKTESKFPFQKQSSIASGLLDEDNEL